MNKVLFQDELPNCMIILKKSSRAHGHYGPQRFQSIGDDGEPVVVDEIALNPHTMRRPAKAVLSTLAHEMVHLWQYHFGKPSRNGYHNKEWADRMDDIGLVPSDTGEAGGQRTGQNMSHFIEEGGAYDRWADKFLQRGKISWASSDLMLIIDGMMPPPPPAEGDGEGEGDEDTEAGPVKPKNKLKYSCREHNVWGKPGLELHCKMCGEDMVAQE